MKKAMKNYLTLSITEISKPFQKSLCSNFYTIFNGINITN